MSAPILSWSKVAEMRAAHAKGASQGALAERFGVAKVTVSAVVRGARWASPPRPPKVVIKSTRRVGRPRISERPADDRVGFCLPPELIARLREAAGRRGVSAFVRDVVVKHLEGM
jgi:hypothetical protein